MIALILGAVGTLATIEPLEWAETPSLADCSRGDSHCLIRSSWEIVRSDLARNGFDPSLLRREEPDRGLVGRDLPLVDAWSRFEGSGWLVGNETGDQVLQELSNPGSRENRNPVTSGRLEAMGSGLRAFARMEQVDHFSDATRSTRLAQLSTRDLSGGSPWDRRAWFGENLPPFSLAGGGIGWSNAHVSVESDYVGGWVWQNLPLSDRLVGWEMRQGTLVAESGPVRATQTLRLLERLGSSGEVRTLPGRAGWRTWGRRLEAGMDWRAEESSGPGGTASSLETAPWIRHSLTREDWKWSGFHRVGTDGTTIHDTVSRGTRISESSWKIAANLQLTDHPDQLHPEIESVLLGREQSVSRAWFQQYGLAAGAEVPWGKAICHAEVAPWLSRSPRAFALDSIDDRGRFGTLRALDGTLWGSVQTIQVRMESSRWTSNAGVRHLVLGGAPATLLDISPPQWISHLSGQAEGPTGLAAGARLAWQSRTMVRNLEPVPWVIPAGYTVDFWVVQRLEKWGLSAKAALLDLTASDRPDLPRGGQRRPRLLVAMDWQPSSGKPSRPTGSRP